MFGADRRTEHDLAFCFYEHLYRNVYTFDPMML